MGTQRFRFLVNNAGIGINAPFAETSEEQFDQLMNIQLKGPFFLTQALLPIIIDGGRIINISTGLSRFVLPGFATYAAMKGAMEVLTRYQAKELGSRGISVNILAPGAIETDLAAVWCAITSRLTTLSPHKPPWDAWVYLKILAKLSPCCCQMRRAGLMVNVLRPRVACSSKASTVLDYL